MTGEQMYTLLTGATGLVGRYLVRDLLLNGHNLAVVVRPSRKCAPRERMEQILQYWEEELGRPLPRPVVLSGDIAEHGFGLSETDREWIQNNVRSIIHSAAILEFYGSDRAGEPWRTNLGGTRNMIALCRDLDIRDIHYVSTAYVAGMQSQPVMEDSLESGQSFRNDYEESKFLAEQEVRAIDFADHITIYRPAVISGDSVTGYTNTYHGIYLYLRLMSLMIPAVPPGPDGQRYTPIRLRMDGTERRNIIPVDWVSAVTVRLFETQAARGGTYHMAPDKPLTSGDLIRWCGEYFNTTGAEFCGKDFQPETERRDDNEDQWMFERLAVENMGTYEPYERTDNVFDMTNTKRFAGDIVCPEIDKTVIHRYLEFGNHDRWGKAKPTDVSETLWAEDLITERAAGAEDADAVLDLDVIGEGGGQWRLLLNGTGFTVVRGLQNSGTPVLRLSVRELVEILDDPQNSVSRMASKIDSPDHAAAERLSLQLADLLAGVTLTPSGS
ncbi:MAG: SDR family oxidoreductase [Planctomycetaceae bacterium]|nr:SDR family oxidoreductase [Planctomycetaceae bacterium]